MHHRKAKEGEGIVLSRDDVRIVVHVNTAKYGKASLSIDAPEGWDVFHAHLERPGLPISDLTTPTQPR